MSRHKPPTNKEKIETYELLLQNLTFHRQTTGNRVEVAKLLKAAEVWVLTMQSDEPEKVADAFQELKTTVNRSTSS